MNKKLAKLPTCLLSTLLSVTLASAVPPIALAQGGSLAEAYKIISSKQFVDLIHSFSP